VVANFNGKELIMPVMVQLKNGGTPDHVGIIPMFLDQNDERTATQQFDAKYTAGGGWNAFGKGKWVLGEDGSLKYPGDPAYKPRARIDFREETIYIYDSAWVCVKQPDGTFEVSRMD
jgi:hypothetical protein